jgi:exodeoxyribonuclease VII small subunit
MGMSEKNLSFEQALLRIDEIVRSLEKGEVTLSESMKLFEEGTALIRRCGDELDKAEQKVVRLRKGEDGQPEELPFDGEE